MAVDPVQTEVASLENVLFKLSQTKEEDLGNVLSRLLPLLLGKFTESAPQIVQGKLLAIFSHINQRVKDRLAVKLPLLQLLSILKASSSRLQTNFCLVYIKMCLPPLATGGSTGSPTGSTRCSKEEYEAAALTLLELESFGPRMDVALQLLWRLLPYVTVPPLAEQRYNKFKCLFAERPAEAVPAPAPVAMEASGGTPEASEAGSSSGSAAVVVTAPPPSRSMELLASFFMDLLLTPKPPAAASSPPAGGAAAPAAAASADPARLALFALPSGASMRGYAAVYGVTVPAAPAAPAPASPPPLPGPEDFSLAASKGQVDPSELYNAKRTAVRMLTAASFFPPYLSVPLCLVGAEVGLGHADLQDPCEDLLKRLVSVQHRDVEDDRMVRAIAALLTGTPASPTVPAADARSAMPLGVQVRALHLLTRSKRAATTFPMALQLGVGALFAKAPAATATASGAGGVAALPKLRVLAVNFMTQSFLLTEEPSVKLKPYAPLYLKCLMEAVDKEQRGESQPSPTSAAAASEAAATGPSGSGYGMASRAALDARREEAQQAVRASIQAGDRERFKEALFSAIGVLVSRLPDLPAMRSLSVPRLLFKSLAAVSGSPEEGGAVGESSSLRLSIAEALSSVSTVFKWRYTPKPSHPNSSQQEREALLDILQEHVEHRDLKVRLAVLQWCRQCFPFSDVRARYLCCRLVSDPVADVRTQAKQGLIFSAHGTSSRGDTKAFRGIDGDNDRADLSGIAITSSGAALAGAGDGGGGGAASDRLGARKKASLEGGTGLITDDDDGLDEAEDALAEAEDDADDDDGPHGALGRVARFYPLFGAMTQFLTTPFAGSSSPRSESGSSSPSAAKRPRLFEHYVSADPSEKLPADAPAAYFPCLSLAACLEFCSSCLDASAAMVKETTGEYILGLDSADNSTLLRQYNLLLQAGLGADPALPDASALHEVAASCLARLLSSAPINLSRYYATPKMLDWLTKRLSEPNKRIRTHVANVLGVAAAALPFSTPASSTEPSVERVLASLVASAAGNNDHARGVYLKHGSLVALGATLSRLAAHRAAGTADSGSSLTTDGSMIRSAAAVLFAPLMSIGSTLSRLAGRRSSAIADSGSVTTDDGSTIRSAASVVLAHLSHPTAFIREASVGALTTLARASGGLQKLLPAVFLGDEASASSRALAESVLIKAKAAVQERDKGKARVKVTSLYFLSLALAHRRSAAAAGDSASLTGKASDSSLVPASRLSLMLQLHANASGIKLPATLVLGAQTSSATASDSLSAVFAMPRELMAAVDALVASPSFAPQALSTAVERCRAASERWLASPAASITGVLGAASKTDEGEDSAAAATAAVIEAAAISLGALASSEVNGAAALLVETSGADSTAAVAAAADQLSLDGSDAASLEAAAASAVAAPPIDESLYDDNGVSAADDGKAAAPPLDASMPLLLSSLATSSLLSLSMLRLESVQFTVGQALVEAVTGNAIAAASAAAAYTGAAAAATSAVVSPSSVTADSPLLSATSAALREKAGALLLDRILQAPLQSDKGLERQSACIWLLCLTHGLLSPSSSSSATPRSKQQAAAFKCLIDRIPYLQTAFMRLLSGEKSAFIQETAAKGMALLYHQAAPDAATKQKLLSSLLQAFDTGRKATMASTLPSSSGAGGTTAAADGAAPSFTASTAIGGADGAGPSSMALAAGGDNAYKELLAMANESGSPDLIYQLLALSSYQASWHTRGGAAYGLEALLTATTASSARRSLAPFISKLIPKLYRYTYDPSARVRDPMSRLWEVLVKDHRRAIAAHVHTILPELIAVSSTSYEWRQREGALLALNDALQGGRSAEEVGPHLEGLWKTVIRGLDDDKDTVRSAASSALKTLSKLSIRLCDAKHGSPNAAARHAVSVMLSFLLAEGLRHHDEQARMVCLQVLVDVSAVAGPLLRPHIPELVYTSLQALSELESSQASYLSMHANVGNLTYGGTKISQEMIEAARLEHARSGPLAQVLNSCMAQLREMPLAELDAAALTAVDDDADDAGAAGGGKKKKAAVASSADAEPGGDGSKPAGAAPAGGILKSLIARLSEVVLKGINVPSRGVAARFIVQMVNNLGEYKLKHSALALVKPLVQALSDSSPLLRKEFVTATAHLARICKRGTITRIVTRLSELAKSSSTSEDSGGGAGGASSSSVDREVGLRITAGRGFLALATQAPERIKGHHGEILPICFLARNDPHPGVKAAFEEAWESLTSSAEEQSLRLYLSETVDQIAGALDNSAWVIKKQGARALVSALRLLSKTSGFVGPSLTGMRGDSSSSGGASKTTEGVGVLANAGTTSSGYTAGDAAAAAAAMATPIVSLPMPYAPQAPQQVQGGPVQAEARRSFAELFVPPQCVEMAAHTPRLLPLLLSSVPGRIWEGKDSLVTALAELAARTSAASAPSATAVVRLLVNQVKRGYGPGQQGSSVGLPWTAACAAGLAAVLASLSSPSVRAAANIPLELLSEAQDAVTTVLSSLKRVSSSFEAGSAAATGAGTTAASSGAGGVKGMKVDEAKVSEGRTLAKVEAADEATTAAACYLALAASAAAATDTAEPAGNLATRALERLLEAATFGGVAAAGGTGGGASSLHEKLALCKAVAIAGATGQKGEAPLADAVQRSVELLVRIAREEDRFTAVRIGALQALVVVAVSCPSAVKSLSGFCEELSKVGAIQLNGEAVALVDELQAAAATTSTA